MWTVLAHKDRGSGKGLQTARDDAQGLAGGVRVDGRDEGLAASQVAGGPVQVHRQTLAPRGTRTRWRRPMDFILAARIEQRLTGLTPLGNEGPKWVGCTRFATQSPVANLSLGYLPSRSPPAHSAGSLAAGVVPSPTLLEQGSGPVEVPGAI
jgi:hypothetical protein